MNESEIIQLVRKTVNDHINTLFAPLTDRDIAFNLHKYIDEKCQHFVTEQNKLINARIKKLETDVIRMETETFPKWKISVNDNLKVLNNMALAHDVAQVIPYPERVEAIDAMLRKIQDDVSALREDFDLQIMANAGKHLKWQGQIDERIKALTEAVFKK